MSDLKEMFVGEATDYEDFKRFYEQLVNKEKIFYMFFSTGLLHWVRKATQFIPDEINLVLIGAGLSADEQLWIRNNYSRPFYHVKRWYSDHYIWEMLLLVNGHHFGWIDIDCFVFEPQLFKEISDIEPMTVINSIWSYKDRCSDLEFSHTFFLFINIDAVKQIRRSIKVTPFPYKKTETYVFHENITPRVLSNEIINSLTGVMPFDQDGFPVIPASPFDVTRDIREFYDTFAVYEMVALSLGYKSKRVRSFCYYNELNVEALHIGMSSYYQKFLHVVEQFDVSSDTTRFVTQCFSYMLLEQGGDLLPLEYQLRKRKAAAEMRSVNLSPDLALQYIKKMSESTGFDQALFARLWEV